MDSKQRLGVVRTRQGKEASQPDGQTFMSADSVLFKRLSVCMSG